MRVPCRVLSVAGADSAQHLLRRSHFRYQVRFTDSVTGGTGLAKTRGLSVRSGLGSTQESRREYRRLRTKIRLIIALPWLPDNDLQEYCDL